MPITSDKFVAAYSEHDPVKAGLGVVQGHWKWHHSRDRIWVPIRLPLQLWPYLVSFAR